MTGAQKVAKVVHAAGITAVVAVPKRPGATIAAVASAAITPPPSVTGKNRAAPRAGLGLFQIEP